ncbi:hypothetical protein [Cytobacillus purgationiresistens]|uniref:DNA repair exonuclease SbcCD nuclease subunit n=1 Tax=Cytobacillus purgationiresistens TaxID=863449 RepID=A0ABU0AK81_9BACI|nr:hypothetical protein [Cytobacillus purgationiresistens]MDQ0271664.1 DNA repair exonuclease SbcCD nuclease subunit [Cytobacillus purgationiresistens]
MDYIPSDEAILKLKIYKKEREQRLQKIKKAVQERLQSIKERNVMKARIIISSAVLRRRIEQEVKYIKWCEDSIRLIESCKFLWDEKDERPFAYSDVETALEAYFAELIEF